MSDVPVVVHDGVVHAPSATYRHGRLGRHNWPLRWRGKCGVEGYLYNVCALFDRYERCRCAEKKAA